MSELREISVNQLPSPTWNWLKVNEAYIKISDRAVRAAEDIEAGKELVVTAQLDKEKFAKLESGMGESFNEVISSYGIKEEQFKLSKKAALVKINVTYSQEEFYHNNYLVEVADDSELTFIMNFSAEEGAATKAAACDTRFVIGKRAKVKLVQIHSFTENMKFYNNVSAECEEDAGFEVIHIELTAAGIYEGLVADLKGDRSSLRIDTAYLGKNEEDIDFNYVARHRGKETKSNIYANGVLCDRSKKVFRGTIDFIRGCSGAVGDEKEDVLLMDADVVNKTTPLILCAEEDVEGTHGATIGKLSDDVLFYFMSRGISEEEAYKQMADGRISEVASRIEDEATKTYIFEKLLMKGDSSDE